MPGTSRVVVKTAACVGVAPGTDSSVLALLKQCGGTVP